MIKVFRTVRKETVRKDDDVEYRATNDLRNQGCSRSIFDEADLYA
jgi:hypothetical protein